MIQKKCRRCGNDSFLREIQIDKAKRTIQRDYVCESGHRAVYEYREERGDDDGNEE